MRPASSAVVASIRVREVMAIGMPVRRAAMRGPSDAGPSVCAMSLGALDRFLLPWAEEAEPFTELQLRALVVAHAGGALGTVVVRWTRSAIDRGLLERVDWASGPYLLVTEAGQQRRDAAQHAPPLRRAA